MRVRGRVRRHLALVLVDVQLLLERLLHPRHRGRPAAQVEQLRVGRGHERAVVRVLQPVEQRGAAAALARRRRPLRQLGELRLVARQRDGALRRLVKGQG